MIDLPPIDPATIAAFVARLDPARVKEVVARKTAEMSAADLDKTQRIDTAQKPPGVSGG